MGVLYVVGHHHKNIADNMYDKLAFSHVLYEIQQHDYWGIKLKTFFQFEIWDSGGNSRVFGRILDLD